MERISYKNFKNDEMYFYSYKNSYDSADKTILVEERSLVEFDYKILKDFEPIHLRYINVCDNEENKNYGILLPAFSGNKSRSYIDIDYSYDFNLKGKITHTFINHRAVSNLENVYKYYFDKYFKTVELNDDEKEKLISKLESKVDIISSIDRVKILIEKGLADNLTITKLESNISFSRGDLCASAEEEPKKVITMKYSDYRRTDFDSVKDSYNKDDKTIDVYVPVDYEYKLK